MKRFLAAAVLIVGLPTAYALADFLATQGSGLTFFDFTCFTTKHCTAHVPINSAGTEIGTSGAPIRIDPTGTTAQPVNVTNANANGQATMANSSPVVIASNQSAVPINAAPTSSSTLALPGVTCGSAASSCVLKASAGNLYGVYAECTSACWLMVFNSTSAPSDGATTAGIASGNLVECIDISANSSKSLTYPTFPRSFSVGITAVISSTACSSKTASTVGFVSGTVQ